MKKFWRQVRANYQLDAEHVRILQLACEQFDRAAFSGPRPRSGLPCARGPLPQCTAETARSAPEVRHSRLVRRHWEVTPYHRPNFRLGDNTREMWRAMLAYKGVTWPSGERKGCYYSFQRGRQTP
jgi:hypothetical protein